MLPENRPSAAEISEVFVKWQSNDNILLELSKSNMILEDHEQDGRIHSKTTYESKLYYTTSAYKDNELAYLSVN
ncbi:hypothetical protein C2G38_2011645 [Gigaspora rosea]|uniref:Uncharacterized protein n=1 Tax=Gigaspora rosea TaxID=44941 RepID=A0A397W0X1_9GLOM|nr:hypothetical protein C2G38_2011645 [Gigaspora rosea]